MLTAMGVVGALVVLAIPEWVEAQVPEEQTLAETLGLAQEPVLVVWVARGPLETVMWAQVLPLELA